MVRILHAADFHLDSAFGALDEERSRERRQEGRLMAERLVDFANDQGVQLVLLAGDLFDSDRIYGQTGEMLGRALGRLTGHAVIAPGNHDYYGAHSAYARLSWPDNVHIFTDDRLERFDFPQYQCTVYGAAFTSPRSDNGALLDQLALPSDGSVHLMVLHGDLSAGESEYRPIRPEQIARSGLDYLALGHVHTCSGVQTAGKTAYAYSGCPEGRGFDELGDKGFLLGDVAPGHAELHFVSFARRRYEIVQVDVTDRSPAQAVTEALPRDTAADIYRVILTGETETPPPMERLQRELADRFYQLELRDQTRMRQDIWKACGDDSLRGLFLRRLREEYDRADETEKAKIELAVRFGLAAMDNREI